MRVRWYGTASIVIETNLTKIIFDPFVPLRYSKVDTRLEDYDGFDSIVVTHGHFDHISSIPDIVSRNVGVKIYCTKTPYNTLRRRGISEEHLIKISPNDVLNIGDIKITVYKSKHAVLQGSLTSYLLKSRTYRYIKNVPYILSENNKCPEANETVLFWVEADGKKVAIMGSMNLAKDVVYPTGCDLLVLPYVGYRDNLAHAKPIIQRLKPKKIILDHWDDTFPPITIEVDTTKVKKEYEGNIDIITINYKEDVEL